MIEASILWSNNLLGYDTSSKKNLFLFIETMMAAAAASHLLKPVPAFAETRQEDVFASLPHHGKPKTLGRWKRACLPRPGADMLTIDINLSFRSKSQVVSSSSSNGILDVRHVTRFLLSKDSSSASG